MLTEPLRDTPEPSALQAAFGVLYGNGWSAAPEEWAAQTDEELGLAPAALMLEADYGDGSTEWLRIGAEEPSGNWRVARRGQELLRFRIPGFRPLARPLQQWRDHRLQPLGVHISRLTWTPESGERVVVEKADGGWYLREPVQAPLAETAEPFLLSLLGGRVDGLDKGDLPRTPDRGKVGTLALEKGNEEVKLEVYTWGVVSDRRDFLLSHDQRNFRFLDLPLEELVSRRILDMDPDRIASLRIEWNGRSADYRRHPDGWVRSGSDAVTPEDSAFVAALLEHGALLERGEETLDLPDTPPSGRLLYSISRVPKDKGSKILRWWVDAEGRNLVASEPGSHAYVSTVNFELGVRSLFEDQP